jgi:hypothetical protein
MTGEILARHTVLYLRPDDGCGPTALKQAAHRSPRPRPGPDDANGISGQGGVLVFEPGGLIEKVPNTLLRRVLVSQSCEFVLFLLQVVASLCRSRFPLIHCWNACLAGFSLVKH